MPTYNFTVRATDESGAYSDRDFAINVRNTIVDRYVIAYAGTTYNEVLTSTNAQSWTERAGALPLNIANSSTTSAASTNSGILYGNGRWFAWQYLASNNIRCSISTDGINWTHYTSIILDESPNSLYKDKVSRFFFINGEFCAVVGYTPSGGSTVRVGLIRSEDGINWYSGDPTGSITSGLASASHLDPSNMLNFINGSWYYATSNGTFKSTNGSTWVSQATPAANASFRGWYYFNGLWMVPDQGTTSRVFTSNDGITWVARPLTLPASTKPSKIIYGNGRLVMTLRNIGNASDINCVMTSVDGINWEPQTFETYGKPPQTYSLLGHSTPCVYSNGLFILGSTVTNPSTGTPGLRVSTDGVNWEVQNTEISMPIFSIAAMDM